MIQPPKPPEKSLGLEAYRLYLNAYSSYLTRCETVSKDTNRTSKAKAFAQSISNKVAQAAPIVTTTAKVAGGAKVPTLKKAAKPEPTEPKAKAPKNARQSKRALKRAFLKKMTEAIITPSWSEDRSPYAIVFDSFALRNEYNRQADPLREERNCFPERRTEEKFSATVLRKKVKDLFWKFLVERCESVAVTLLVERLSSGGYMAVWEIIKPQLSSQKKLRVSAAGKLAWADSF